MKNDSYYVKEYHYNTKNYDDLTGSCMKIWDGDEPYYFFFEISKILYNYLMHNGNDLVTVIVWGGELYDYVNPEDAFQRIFTFRSASGKERNIFINMKIV